jgi:hypothetical protein
VNVDKDQWWFPQEDDLAVVCSRTFESEGIFMWRLIPNPKRANDSRWVIFCDDEDHDHDENLLEVASLLEIEHQRPGLTNFLALPAKTQVFVDPGRRRADGQALVHGTVFLDGDEEAAEPNPGSYLMLLNEGAEACLQSLSADDDAPTHT